MHRATDFGHGSHECETGMVGNGAWIGAHRTVANSCIIFAAALGSECCPSPRLGHRKEARGKMVISHLLHELIILSGDRERL